MTLQEFTTKPSDRGHILVTIRKASQPSRGASYAKEGLKIKHKRSSHRLVPCNL